MRQPRLHLLDGAAEDWFPPVELALEEPNGLLALGGSLSATRLLSAYARGIFPWFERNQPPLWWSPDPRSILFPENLRVTRSLRKRIRNSGLRVTLDQCFADVIQACAGPRRDSNGTWITTGMQQAYTDLHQRGLAHSVEVWQDQALAGGLYGIAMGRAFFGESMFSRQPDASKIALVHLVRQLQDWGYALVDCQVSNAHLASLGATDIPRSAFMAHLARALSPQPGCPVAGSPGFSGLGRSPGPWTLDPGFDPLRPRTGEQP